MWSNVSTCWDRWTYLANEDFENHNEDFTVWVRMLIAVWDEMFDSKPIVDTDDESKVTFI